MTRDRRDSTAGWTVGARFWTPMNGTATVHEVRPRDTGMPEALVSYGWLPDVREWIVLPHVEPMLAGEPDRPSEGLQHVEAGQSVRHGKFGEGMVRGLYAREGGAPGAAIEFGTPFGERKIALGGGYLRAKKPPDFAVEFTGCDAGWIRLRLDGEGLRPALHGWCEGWDHMADAECRRQRLLEVLNCKDQGYGGTPLRELRSLLVERWLADEGGPVR